MFPTTPFATEFVSLRNAMDQLMNESFLAGPSRTIWSRGGGNGQSVAQAPLPLDVYATDDAFVITAAAPGLRPEDLELTVNRGTIILSGRIANVAESAEAKGATWYVHELWHGRFQRAVTPPFEVDADKAEAHFENGILRVRLPKAEHAKPQRIPVQVTAGDAARDEAIAATAGAATEGS
jgi:HSP20 family protein